jgi:hypothetical protein
MKAASGLTSLMSHARSQRSVLAGHLEVLADVWGVRRGQGVDVYLDWVALQFVAGSYWDGSASTATES